MAEDHKIELLIAARQEAAKAVREVADSIRGELIRAQKETREEAEKAERALHAEARAIAGLDKVTDLAAAETRKLRLEQELLARELKDGTQASDAERRALSLLERQVRSLRNEEELRRRRTPARGPGVGQQLGGALGNQTAIGGIAQAGMVAGGVTVGLAAFAGAAQLAGAAVRELSDQTMLAVEAAEVQAKAERDVAVALRLSGQEVEANLAMLKEQASAMQTVAAVGDEEVLRLQALALNYGATAEMAAMAATAAVDFAAATGKTVDEAILQISKTLGGYGGELQEVIPAVKTFTVEQLRNGAAIEHVAERYRGAASAQLTFGERLEQTSNLLGDIRERLGESITESTELTAVIEEMNKVFSELADSDFGTIIGDAIADAVQMAVAALQVFADLQGFDEMADSLERVGDRLLAARMKARQATDEFEGLKEAANDLRVAADHAAGGLDSLNTRFEERRQAFIDNTRDMREANREFAIALIQDEAERLRAQAELDRERVRNTLAAEREKAEAIRLINEQLGQDLEAIQQKRIEQQDAWVDELLEAEEKRVEEEKRANEQLLGMRQQLALDMAKTEEERLQMEADFQIQAIEQSKAHEASKAAAILDVRRRLNSDLADLELQRQNNIAAGIGEAGAELIDIMTADAADRNRLLRDFAAGQAAIATSAWVMETVPPPASFALAPIVAAAAHAAISALPIKHTGGLSEQEQLTRTRRGEFVVGEDDVARVGGPAGVMARLRQGGSGGGGITLVVNSTMADVPSIQRALDSGGVLNRELRRAMGRGAL